MSILSILRETRGALGANLVAVRARPRHTLLTAAGFLLAGLTLVVLLTVPAGMQRIAAGTGLDDVALVLGSSATSAIGSSVAPADVAILGTLPGVAHAADGAPLVAPQFLASVKLRQTDGSMATALVRGVSPRFWQVIGKQLRALHGKQFQPGVDQLIAGVAATQRFAALRTGAQVRIRNATWRVTATFDAGGGIWGSELWTDIAALQAAYNSQGQVSVVWVKLASPAAYQAFAAAVAADPRLQNVRSVQQRKYYAHRVGFVTHYANIAVAGIAAVLGTGAALAIVNALGMSLAARRRETAVLRAIGFHRRSVALALLGEVLLTALACAGIAIVVGWWLVNGHAVNSSTLGQAVRFSMQMTAADSLWTVVYLLALGLLAALWPIARAVRAPLTRALQDE